MKFRFTAKQGEPVTIVGRIRDPLNNLIKQALTSSMTARVYDMFNAKTLISTIVLSIAAVVSDSLQTGLLWQDFEGRAIDPLGYNFVWTTPQTIFPNWVAGQSYLVEIEVVLTNGIKFTGEVQIDISQILSAPLP